MQIIHTAFVAILFTLSSCATINNSDKDKLDTAKYSTITTYDAVNLAETNIRDSEKNELDVYAPDHFLAANKALEEARALLLQSQPREKVVQKVAVAEAVLRNGDMVMRNVKNILAAEIKIKNNLKSINTQSTYEVEYGSLNERFNKIIREIEAGNETAEGSREQLLKDMQFLERKALHYNAMNEPREILKRVKYSGGEQLAPITYNEAMDVFKRAEEFINRNPNFEEGIVKIGQEALFAAKRALYVTEGVSSLKQKVAFAPEQVILDEEYRLYRVARQLADFDYRDKSLEVQSELLAKGAKAIALELKNKDELVIALRDTLIKVRDSSSRLTLLSESTERFKSEKDRWLAKEALFKAKVDQLATQLETSEGQLDATQQKLLTFKNSNSDLTRQINANKNLTAELESKISLIEVTQKTEASKRENAALQADEAAQLHASQIAESQAMKDAELQANKAAAQLAIAEAEKQANDTAAMLAKRGLELQASQDAILQANQSAELSKKESATALATREIELAKKEAELLAVKAAMQKMSEEAELNTNKLTAILAKKDAELEANKANALQAISAAEAKAEEASALLTTKNSELQASKLDAKKAHSEAAKLRKSQLKLTTVSSTIDDRATTINTQTKKQVTIEEQPRAKITEEETLKALESVKELLSSLENNAENIEPEIKVVHNNSSDDFLDDEDNDLIDADDSDNVFVDASE